MKMTRLMAVALCAAASVTTTTFAEDDLIESASPVAIADPVNPQPGMVLSGYKISFRRASRSAWLKDSIPTLPKTPAIKTVVDKSEYFSLKPLDATEANVGMWSGFLKCKRAGVYTLTLSGGKTVNEGYSLRVNGKTAIASGKAQTSADVALKVGWNKIELVGAFGKKPINLSFKPKDSLSDARSLTPAMMFYDKKPEEDW